MASDYDQYDRRDDFDEVAPPGEREIRAVRGRLAVPGMILLLFGLLGMGIVIACLVGAFTQPMILHDQVKSMVEGMPPGQERTDQLKQLEDTKAEMSLDTPSNIAACVIGWLLCFLMTLGGASMRRLGSYGLAMTGAICGLIPISGCCCFAMPVGLWAVIALSDGNVRKAFRANARR